MAYTSPYLEKLKRENRNAWIGTMAGVGFILLTVLFILEVNFAQAFVGERLVLRWALNLTAGSALLAWLVLKDNERFELLDKVKLGLMSVLVAGMFWYWLLGFVNRIGRTGTATYPLAVTYDATRSKREKKSDSGEYTITYRHEVLDGVGRRTYFNTPDQRYPSTEPGDTITVPVTRGRLGQDFIKIIP